MKTLKLMAASLLAATSLSGCDRLDAAWTAFQGSAPATHAPDTPVLTEPEPNPPVGRLTPTGRGLPVKASPGTTDQEAASVVEVHTMSKQADMTVKLFGTAGGDPAMNGLRTYVAFYRNPANGWWIYQVGDFLSFEVLNENPGQIDLEVEESVLDETTGTIGSRKRRIIIGFPVGPVGDQPVSVRFMPAA